MRRHTLLCACLRAGFCLVLLLSAQTSFGQMVKTINLNCSELDFSYVYDEDSCLSIYSEKWNTVDPANIGEPALPIMFVSVLLDPDQDVSAVGILGNKAVIGSNIVMAPTPDAIPTNIESPNIPHRQIAYQNGIFPKEQVQHIETSMIGGYRVAKFKVCPYKYDVGNRTLSFINGASIVLTLTISSQAKNIQAHVAQNHKDESFARELVINGEDIDSYYTAQNTEKKKLSVNQISNDDKVDYLIITTSALASTFQELADWKTKKGVRTKVETVENIMTKYPSYSWRSQLRMKHFIYDYYLAHGIEYLLLGGDYDIVPAQGCYTRYQSSDSLYTDIMPADIFYATFQGNFGWDANGNGLVGEAGDGMSTVVDICYSRAPVRNVYQASVFVGKVIEYETNPPVEDWKNKMLMVAGTLEGSLQEGSGYVSDSYYYSGLIRKRSILPYWGGNCYRWSNRYESEIGSFPSTVLPQDFLQEQLEGGYSFLHINTHGRYKSFNITNDIYHRDKASALNNKQPMIIVSSACNNNEFDNPDDPCISESFIRNPNSGVIAFLGNTRLGWYHKGSYNLGPSNDFNRRYYLYLFRNPNEDKNWGKVVQNAKNSDAFNYDEYTPERWIHLGTNPVGDYEMPIYLTTPKIFSNVEVEKVWTGLSTNIKIDTGVDSCRVCISDAGTNFYHVEKNARTVMVNAIDSFTLCISKQGYVTYCSTVKMGKNGEYYLQNETIHDNQYISASNVYVGNSVTTEKTFGDVIVKKGRLEIKANKTYIANGFEVKKGAELIIK